MQPHRNLLLTVKLKLRRLLNLVPVLIAASAGNHSFAEDWGLYSISPFGGPAVVMEAVNSGTGEGTVVSLGKAVSAPNQKWVISPKGDNLYSIRPSYSSTLVLSVAKGGVKKGTAIVMETDSGQPWQLWALTKQENGSYTLTPKHAPDKGLDDFGGDTKPGAKLDLWENKAGDRHLQWFIKPLAGSPLPATGAADAAATGYVPPAIKPADILPGTTKQFTFAQSKIFPGTVRDVTVFIPAQYDGKKPACVYVKTDGFNPREKTLHGDDDRDEGNARDGRRLRAAGHGARADEGHARPAQSLLRIRRHQRQPRPLSHRGTAPVCRKGVSAQSLDRRQRPLHLGRQQRRHRGIHGGVASARGVQPRVCGERELGRVSRRA